MNLEPLDIPSLIEINDAFLKYFLSRNHGELLNVISKPENASEEEDSMFQISQEALLSENQLMQERIQDSKVNIHTLSYSPQSFLIQTDSIPAHIAHDLMPTSCSAREIASFGYSVTGARREVKPGTGN